MSKAVYPGSFDPITNGHLDIIKRAAKMFDELHILVSYNIDKKSMYNIEDRIEMIKRSTKNLKNVVISTSNDLVVNYCKENKITVIVRGIRNFLDYENEFSLHQYNKEIYNDIDTVLLMPSLENLIVSSSSIKELMKFNHPVDKYVPEEILDILYK
ncbi:MAG: pantetheine-phosphate adenylyltransferase [Anaeroplasma sp.]|nr:pantetheine-phosphate adenylyltransferase [Anaeroplasma sp.]